MEIIFNKDRLTEIITTESYIRCIADINFNRVNYACDIEVFRYTAKMKRMNKRKLKVSIRQAPRTVYKNYCPTSVPSLIKTSDQVSLSVEFNYIPK